MTAQGSKRVSIAALIATRPGTTARARLIYRTHLDRGSGKHRRKSFAETEYARLLDGAHQELGGAIVLVWDNLPTHTSRKMRQLIAARSWLTVFQLPADAPELNPVESLGPMKSSATTSWRHVSALVACWVNRYLGASSCRWSESFCRFGRRSGSAGWACALGGCLRLRE